MENVRKSLNKEIKATKAGNGKKIINALNELCYSAEETGVIGFRIDPEDAIIAWKLVEIAKKYKGKLPDSLKV